MSPGLSRRYGDAGLGLLEYNVSAIISEAQTLAQGPIMQWGEVAEGVEDYGTMAPVAAGRLGQLVDLWRLVMATEWAVAGRAILLQGLLVGAPLLDWLEPIRDLESRCGLSPHGWMTRLLAVPVRMPEVQQLPTP